MPKTTDALRGSSRLCRNAMPEGGQTGRIAAARVEDGTGLSGKQVQSQTGVDLSGAEAGTRQGQITTVARPYCVRCL